jgi:hypothetical protein
VAEGVAVGVEEEGEELCCCGGSDRALGGGVGRGGGGGAGSPWALEGFQPGPAAVGDLIGGHYGCCLLLLLLLLLKLVWLLGLLSRCGIASDSECKWEMYRTRRAKAARIYAHAGQRVQQNFFTRAQCAPSTLSPTRAYPRLTPALWIAAWRVYVRQRTKLCSSRCNEDAGNYARPLEPPKVSGKTKWIVGLVERTQISEPRTCVKFISDLN